jgi:hypothetical protein
MAAPKHPTGDAGKVDHAFDTINRRIGVGKPAANAFHRRGQSSEVTRWSSQDADRVPAFNQRGDHVRPNESRGSSDQNPHAITMAESWRTDPRRTHRRPSSTRTSMSLPPRSIFCPPISNDISL